MTLSVFATRTLIWGRCCEAAEGVERVIFQG